jgi:hypothetical protein
MEINREITAILTSVLFLAILVILFRFFTRHKAVKKAAREAEIMAINDHTTKNS